ncbi:unnamed protein product [Tenebrio molitor]|nr:unnamed protein product [Tenebrio molitor]
MFQNFSKINTSCLSALFLTCIMILTFSTCLKTQPQWTLYLIFF